MSTSGKSKPHRQSALPANVPRILAELREFAAANSQAREADYRPVSAGAPKLVLRGK